MIKEHKIQINWRDTPAATSLNEGDYLVWNVVENATSVTKATIQIILTKY